MYDLAVQGGKVYRAGDFVETNVYIKDGKIAKLTDETLSSTEVVDAKGLFVLPGFIDPHVHMALAPSLAEVATGGAFPDWVIISRELNQESLDCARAAAGIACERLETGSKDNPVWVVLRHQCIGSLFFCSRLPRALAALFCPPCADASQHPYCP